MAPAIVLPFARATNDRFSFNTKFERHPEWTKQELTTRRSGGWQILSIYFFFDFPPPLEGFANADVTVDTVGPVLFFTADFFGFLGSRFGLCWPLAISASFNAAWLIDRPVPDIGGRCQRAGNPLRCSRRLS